MGLSTGGIVAIAVCLGVTAIVGTIIGLRMAIPAFLPPLRPTTYADYVRKNPDAAKKRVVCCVGDSHTHGTYGADWVTQLAQARQDMVWVNAGVNQEQTSNVLARIKPIVACRPEVVTVLIGSNERRCNNSKCSACAYAQCCSPTTMETYEKNLRELFTILLRDTDAVIGVFSNPPIENPPGTSINETTHIFNEALRRITASFAAQSARVTYVPLGEQFDKFMTPVSQGGLYDAARPAVIQWSPGTFISNVMRVQFQRWVCCKSYDRISDKYRLKFSTDTIHFNSVGAAIVRDVVRKFVEDVALPALAAAPTASASSTTAAPASPPGRVAVLPPTLPANFMTLTAAALAALASSAPSLSGPGTDSPLSSDLDHGSVLTVTGDTPFVAASTEGKEAPAASVELQPINVAASASA